MSPVALVAERGASGGRREGHRGQDLSQLGSHVLTEGVQAPRLEGLDILVQGVHEHPEGQVALELGRPPRQHQGPSGVGAGAQLGQQARLADTGLARQFDGGRDASAQVVQGAVEDPELRGSADDLMDGSPHESHPVRNAIPAPGVLGRAARARIGDGAGLSGDLDGRHPVRDAAFGHVERELREGIGLALGLDGPPDGVTARGAGRQRGHATEVAPMPSEGREDHTALARLVAVLEKEAGHVEQCGHRPRERASGRDPDSTP